MPQFRILEKVTYLRDETYFIEAETEDEAVYQMVINGMYPDEVTDYEWDSGYITEVENLAASSTFSWFRVSYHK